MRYYFYLQNTCLEVTCGSPLFVLANGSCMHGDGYMTHGVYTVYVTLTPDDIIITNGSDINKTKDDRKYSRVNDLIRDESGLFELALSIQRHYMSMMLKQLVSRDVLLLNTFVRHNISSYTFTHSPGFVVKLDFIVSRYSAYTLSLLDTILEFDNSKTKVAVGGDEIVFKTCLDKLKETGRSNLTVHRLQSLDGNHDYTVTNAWSPNIQFIQYLDTRNATTILPTMSCPLVNVPDYYEVEIQPGLVRVPSWNSAFSWNVVVLDTVVQKPHIKVCMDVFKSVMDKADRGSSSNRGITIRDVLGIVCTVLSLVFASVTVTVYILLRELRTQPGINNMGLCISLIIGQLLQLVVGLNGAKSITVCKVIGVFVHFSWLNVVMWLNVCSLHMFRSFNSMYAPTAMYSLKQTAIYVLYCLGLSVIPVLINMIVNISSDLGYSGDTCYISRPHMVGYTFALPVAIVIVVNVGLFLNVLHILSNRPAVESSNKKEPNNLKIYTKLSTLTGVTWIFGFIFQFTKLVLFDYLFIVLSGGQGCFVFFAFIGNRRVLEMMRQKFQVETSSTTKSTKLTPETMLLNKRN